MIPITFLGVTAYLIDDAPIWDSSLSLDAELPTYVEGGLTQRETRYPLADTLRLSLGYRTLLQGSSLTQFRNSLQALTNERVLCPLWLYQFDIGASPTITASYYVLMGDGAAPVIQPHAALPFARPAYPLLVGQLSDTPDPSLLTDEAAVVDIQFAENDIYAITLPAFTPPAGVSLFAVAKPLFPFQPNWAQSISSGNASVEIERTTIGKSRIQADSFYAQPSRRDLRQAFTLTGTDSWSLLRFLLDQRLSVKTCWIPTGISDARLTIDVGAADFSLTVDNPTGRGSNTTIMLDDLQNRVCLVVNSTVGSVWNMSTQPGIAFDKRFTRIESIALSRLAGQSVHFSFETPDLAKVSLEFTEVPWERTGGSGEVIGTTMGALATNAYLYHFSVAYPGATQHWYYTGFELSLSDGANTYLTGHWEHDPITEADSLERQQSKLRSRMVAGSPLALMAPFALEWPLMVEISECDVAGGVASNLRRLFYGEVIDASPEPPFIDATLKSMAATLDRRVPIWTMGPSCSTILFTPLCGLLEADWKWLGSVASYNALTRQLVLNSVGRVAGADIPLPAGFFAGGYLYFGAGQNAQHRSISDNVALAAGQITLLVATPFTTVPGAGATVTFHPGCDGQYATCLRFNNKANFRNFPFMPVGNPSVLKVSNNVTAGGKK